MDPLTGVSTCTGFVQQLALRSTELEDARSQLSQAEAQLDGIGGETADLRRETRLAQKDRDELAAKLQKERAEAEAAKETFRAREAQLLEQIKNTKKQNRGDLLVVVVTVRYGGLTCKNVKISNR